ncbi:diguanylate cyclase domain-containing protein [Methylobacterium komagatae]
MRLPNYRGSQSSWLSKWNDSSQTSASLDAAVFSIPRNRTSILTMRQSFGINIGCDDCWIPTMIRSASLRPAALPDAIRIELIKSLLSSLPQAASISLTSSFGAYVLAVRSGGAVDFGFALALTGIGVFRVAVLLAYRRRRDAGLTLPIALRWMKWQAVGLLIQAALLGMLSLHAFTSRDTAAALLTLGFVLGFCGGACARLSVVPGIPILAGVLLLVPTIVGALLHPEPPVIIAGLVLIALLAAMIEATLYLHHLVVDRLLALQDALYRAGHDDLTGLANRASFRQHLNAATAEARAGSAPFAVLYLDLDRFKAVNDRLGHEAGDDVLIAVAERLRFEIGERDLACRLGGDEFAILLMNDTGNPRVIDLAERLVAAVARPIPTRRGTVWTSTSVGIAHAAMQAPPADDVLNTADQAMYAAKAAGGARWRSVPAVHARTRAA